MRCVVICQCAKKISESGFLPSRKKGLPTSDLVWRPLGHTRDDLKSAQERSFKISHWDTQVGRAVPIADETSSRPCPGTLPARLPPPRCASRISLSETGSAPVAIDWRDRGMLARPEAAAWLGIHEAISSVGCGAASSP